MTRKILLALPLLLIPVGAVNAQTSQNCTPTQAVPGGDNGIATKNGPDQPMSDKLARSDGVLCPPSTGASDMRVPAPDAGASKMPIIPPPGSPGGDPNVRPK